MHVVRRTSLFCLCYLLFACCNSEKEKSLSAVFEGLHVNVEAEVTKIHSEDISRPMRIECYDNLLISANLRVEKGICVFDLLTGEVVNEFLYVGRGPDEIIRINSMRILRDTLLVYCANSRKLISTPVKDISTPPAKLTTTSNFGIFFSRVLPLDNDFFAATGANEFGYLQLIDSTGKVQILEDFSDDGKSDLPQEKSIAYQGILYGNPAGNKFVYGSSFGLILKFMELSGQTAIKQKEYVFALPHQYTPYSKPQNQDFSIVWNEDALRGVLDITGSDHYCFILYEEHKILKDHNHSLSSSVYVFTWDGIPVQKMNLDRPAKCIAYNASSKNLIALTSNNEHGYDEFVSYPTGLN